MLDRSQRQLASTTLLATFLFSCTTVHTVPKAELAKLDGFTEDTRSLLDRAKGQAAPPRYSLLDDEGGSHGFDEGTSLVLGSGEGSESEIRTELTYREISIVDGKFHGRAREREVELPLEQIDFVGVREFSLGKTLGLVGGIVGGVVVLLAVAVAAAPESEGGGDSDWD